MRKLSNAQIALVRHLVAGHRAPEALDARDWELVLESARCHRLTALLHEGLTRSSLNAPERVGVRLERAFHVETARAVVRLHHVEELARAAARSELSLCLLKGAAFASTLYPNPASRPMADVDVLVRRDDVSKWTAELESLGFVPHIASDHADCFRNRHTGVFLELHQALTSCESFLDIDTERLFERSQPVPGLEPVRTLSLEDHLLHLGLHASFQHGFRQSAVNAWDAHLIVGQSDFEPRAFVERARRPRLARWIFGGWRLSHAVFPHDRLAALSDELSGLVPRTLQRKLTRFDASDCLAPGPDASAHTPHRQLLWAGDVSTAMTLLFEILEPKRSANRAVPFAKTTRALQLLWNHYLKPIPLALMKHEQTFVRQTHASLGEVRDV